jgi:hypothetical protein
MKRSMTDVTTRQQGSMTHCAAEGAECPRRPAATGAGSRAARAFVLFSSLAMTAQGVCGWVGGRVVVILCGVDGGEVMLWWCGHLACAADRLPLLYSLPPPHRTNRQDSSGVYSSRDQLRPRRSGAGEY